MKKARRYIELFGERGYIKANFLENELVAIKGSKRIKFYSNNKFDRNKPFTLQIKYVIELAKNKNKNKNLY